MLRKRKLTAEAKRINAEADNQGLVITRTWQKAYDKTGEVERQYGLFGRGVKKQKLLNKDIARLLWFNEGRVEVKSAHIIVDYDQENTHLTRAEVWKPWLLGIYSVQKRPERIEKLPPRRVLEPAALTGFQFQDGKLVLYFEWTADRTCTIRGIVVKICGASGEAVHEYHDQPSLVAGNQLTVNCTYDV